MTNQEQNQTSLLESLETTRQQITTAQSEIETIVNRMQTFATQIGIALKSLDSMEATFEKMIDNEQNAENNSDKVAQTLEEMFRQVSSIVNNTKEKLKAPTPQEEIVIAETTPTASEKPEIETSNEKITDQITETASNVIPQAETKSTEVLNGIEAGERAADSIDELLSNIDAAETNVEKTATTKIEIAETTEPTPIVSPEQATITPPEALKEIDEPAKTTAALNEALAKAKAIAGSIADVAETDAEDDDAIDKLLKNTSSSFVAN
ncbi:MAG: hypothetical protein LBT05_03945 [Planctomycetaceae bacterium]|jgi:hypothetical protein|nr:hypothetical protein [Planctomycetaceae bacterium]